jgi:hypothetical protein
MGHDQWNMVVCFDANWIATSGFDCFLGQPISYVMDWVKGHVDAFENGYKMEIVFLPQSCYRVIFNFVD